MKITIIHPCVGRRIDQKKYIRTWQMESLVAATLAALTPKEVKLKFYDDRVEPIPYDKPADLVAITIETYTAKRAYQIASEYRKRNIPVVMGGFHASLCPEEVSQYAESVIVGEAESIWKKVLEDAAKDTLMTYYYSERPDLSGVIPDRSIFHGKNYIPVTLIEANRGCSFNCEFCSICQMFEHSHNYRPNNDIVEELQKLRNKKVVFFVDDNIASNIEKAKEFARAISPLKIHWIGQMSINAAHDDELLQLLVGSGCLGVLIGLESLNPINLNKMNKNFNLMSGGYEEALAKLRKFNIRLYITFLFGYDEDSEESIAESFKFAIKHNFYIAAFNHLTPFPGTPLYNRLIKENRLLYEKWWLDDDYSYNQISFQPANISPERLQRSCLEARTRFYTLKSIWKRGFDTVNRNKISMWLKYYGINWSIRKEIYKRNFYPLGDKNWQRELIKVRKFPAPFRKNCKG